MLSGLSPAISIDPAAAQKFWSEQLATGSPLPPGPVTNFAPPGRGPLCPLSPWERAGAPQATRRGQGEGDDGTPDLTIIFTGLEPYEDYTTAGQIVINGLPGDDQIYAVDGAPHLGADTIKVYEANDGFENITFANKHGLWIQGGAGNDTIDISGLSTTSTAFNDLRTGAIWLWGEGGDDVLRTSTDSTITQLVYGGDGNDQLYSMAAAGSAAFVSYLDPGAGDDQIYSGPANDLMLGSTGSDTFFFDTNGFLGSDKIAEPNNDLTANDVDTINVSANTDLTWVTLSYTDWQSINPSNLALKLTDPNGIENFLGGSGGGSILGNSRDNTLTAGPGVLRHQRLRRQRHDHRHTGDDYLVGGNGDDTIVGGAGADTLVGWQTGTFWFVEKVECPLFSPRLKVAVTPACCEY